MENHTHSAHKYTFFYYKVSSLINCFPDGVFFPPGDVKFNSVEPYTKNRLNALAFADIIRDYKVISDGVVPENPLKFLYPDIPKDEAFGRLYNTHSSKGESSKPSVCQEFMLLVQISDFSLPTE